jgi:hypothetical protein
MNKKKKRPIKSLLKKQKWSQSMNKKKSSIKEEPMLMIGTPQS